MQQDAAMDALGSLPPVPSERLAALQHLRGQLQGGGVEVLEALVQQLDALAPDPSLWADVGDAPAPPSGAAQQSAAAAAVAAAALHLQLLAELVGRLEAEQLGLEALAAGGDGAPPPGPPGSVRIEELDAAAPTAQLPAAMALAAALHGADDRLGRPWASGDAAAAAQQLLEALAAKLPAERQPPPAGQPLLQEAATSRARGGAAANPPVQPTAVQRLLELALPAAAQQLRPVVAAKQEHSRREKGRLEPYAGPGSFERCAAAGQLAWLLRQLHGAALSAALPGALPLVLAAVEDPFPPVQACGLWGLQHLAAAGQAADLRPHAGLLLAATKRALAGASDAALPAAAAAAIAVAGRLEGDNPYAQAYHDIMEVLLGEGELGAHNADRAAAWLAAAPPLFARLGLQLAAHFARLMPLLLGWCLDARPAVQAAALEALLEAVRQTWPRIGAHALVLWGVLRRAHDQAAQLSSRMAPPGGPAAAQAVAERAADCGLALWCAAGTAFQAELMTAQGAAQDELLQAVMQRLEDNAQAQEMDAASTAPEPGQVVQAQQPLQGAA